MNFRTLFHTFVEEGLHLELSETFTSSPKSALDNIKFRDINIIVGFFGPEHAREILCMVSVYQHL